MTQWMMGALDTLREWGPLGSTVKVARSNRGLRGGVGNLAHFEHKKNTFNMNNVIFSFRSGAHATLGGQTGAGG